MGYGTMLETLCALGNKSEEVTYFPFVDGSVQEQELQRKAAELIEEATEHLGHVASVVAGQDQLF